MKKFNNFLANKLSIILSSMWLFWVLALVLIILWFLDPPTTPFDISLFVISTAFQAIALPVLAFVSNLQGDRAEKVAKETHDAVMKELALLREQNAELKELVTDHVKTHKK